MFFACNLANIWNARLEHMEDIEVRKKTETPPKYFIFLNPP